MRKHQKHRLCISKHFTFTYKFTRLQLFILYIKTHVCSERVSAATGYRFSGIFLTVFCAFDLFSYFHHISKFIKFILVLHLFPDESTTMS